MRLGASLPHLRSAFSWGLEEPCSKWLPDTLEGPGAFHSPFSLPSEQSSQDSLWRHQKGLLNAELQSAVVTPPTRPENCLHLPPGPEPRWTPPSPSWLCEQWCWAGGQPLWVGAQIPQLLQEGQAPLRLRPPMGAWPLCTLSHNSPPTSCHHLAACSTPGTWAWQGWCQEDWRGTPTGCCHEGREGQSPPPTPAKPQLSPSLLSEPSPSRLLPVCPLQLPPAASPESPLESQPAEEQGREWARGRFLGGCSPLGKSGLLGWGSAACQTGCKHTFGHAELDLCQGSHLTRTLPAGETWP